ncbi:ThiF family adenylyltransferase [uncultured Clostridium sp.]|uniref:HesA/MoeB/ThiF family protein n=1 Tax=uncultured Clostridium sp. TaxID=59620 RepID=UPI0025D2FEAA|nr:ThiF family adenylyltransferase [uncultured Clostridium sp.]
MKEKYYFNPFVFIYEDEVGYIIQDGLNFKINLDKNKGSQLLKRVKENNGFTILELVDYFTENEIISLFSNNILIDYIPDTENRYSRNEGFFYTAKNIKGFSNLKEKKVFLLGAGAIGTHIAWMFSTLNIKKLTILDYDVIEESNLNRQMFYEMSEVGKSKVEVIKNHINKVNPELEIETINDKIDSESKLLFYLQKEKYDLVIRAIDTPVQISSWLNRVCFKLKIPYTSGGFVGSNGVLGPTYLPGITSCYECFENELSLDISREYGIGGTLSALTELVASKVAFEGIKILCGNKCSYIGQMEWIDPIKNNSIMKKLDRKQKCQVCGSISNNKKENSNLFISNLIYFLIVACIPVLISTPNWPFYGTLLLVGGSQLILQFGRSAEKVFQTAFIGGTLYGLVNIILTFRLNIQILNLDQEFIFALISVIMLVITMISMAIVVFIFINTLLFIIRKKLIDKLAIIRLSK